MEWSVYKDGSLSLLIEIQEPTEHSSRTSQISRQMELDKEAKYVKHYQGKRELRRKYIEIG